LAAVQGRDPFGRDLQVSTSSGDHTGSPTAGQKAGIIANTLAESFLPYLAQGRRLREGGGTPYSNSTIVSPQVKPGTSSMSAVRRTFDPFRPTYLRGGPSTGAALLLTAIGWPRHDRTASRSDRVSRASAASGTGCWIRSSRTRLRRATGASRSRWI
jgi:hypothetical protein